MSRQFCSKSKETQFWSTVLSLDKQYTKLLKMEQRPIALKIKFRIPTAVYKPLNYPTGVDQYLQLLGQS